MYIPAAAPVILVAAIDLSEISPLVARRARETARQLKAAQLHFVHVHVGAYDDGTSARDCERLGQWLGAQREDGDRLPPSFQVLAHESSGDPAQVIVELATRLRASCTIVGARSRTSGPAGGLGPVARAVVGASDCPVLVVRPAAQLAERAPSALPA